MGKRTHTNPIERPEDSPVAWFAVLEMARRTGDLGLAATARRELERLGVVIVFTDEQEVARGE